MNFLEKLIPRLEQNPGIMWSITLMYAGMIFYLSSIPITQPPILDKISFISTIEHIIEFAIFGTLLLISFRSIKQDSILAVVVLVCFYGFSDEIHQLFTPGRVFDVWDILADCVGGVCGAFMAAYHSDRIIKIKQEK